MRASILFRTMNNMQLCKKWLFVAMLFTIEYGQTLKAEGNPAQKLKEGAINMIASVHDVMKKYENVHTIGNEGLIAIMKNNLARKCRNTKDLSPKDQANEIMKILQEFVTDLQQMQIDEMTLHVKEEEEKKNGAEITRALRMLEYDLRDLVETNLRGFIKEHVGPVTVSYSLGSLPSIASKGSLPLVVSTHYYKLEMLRSCISDVLCMKRWMHLMINNSTRDMMRVRSMC